MVGLRWWSEASDDARTHTRAHARARTHNTHAQHAHARTRTRMHNTHARTRTQVRDDGSTEWKFEAQEDNLQSNTLDVGVFWLGLIAPALVWFLFGIGSLFR